MREPANTVGKQYKDSRLGCGILNFLGEISKVLFGTLDEDADYYDEQIRNFERNSEYTTDLLKQQVYAIKSTGLFISPSGISELDCATTKTDTAERNISIGRESLQVFFLY